MKKAQQKIKSAMSKYMLKKHSKYEVNKYKIKTKLTI